MRRAVHLCGPEVGLGTGSHTNPELLVPGQHPEMIELALEALGELCCFLILDLSWVSGMVRGWVRVYWDGCCVGGQSL